MLDDVRAVFTYIDRETGETWTRGEERWTSRHDFRQYLHLNSDRIKSLEVVKW